MKTNKFDEFEMMVVSKIDNREFLTEDILSELIYYEIEEQNIDQGRWTTSVTSILSLCGRYFSFNWERGNTEMQSNEFYCQPFEVKKKEETITVTRWVKK